MGWVYWEEGNNQTFWWPLDYWLWIDTNWWWPELPLKSHSQSKSLCFGLNLSHTESESLNLSDSYFPNSERYIWRRNTQKLAEFLLHWLTPWSVRMRAFMVATALSVPRTGPYIPKLETKSIRCSWRDENYFYQRGSEGCRNDKFINSFFHSFCLLSLQKIDGFWRITLDYRKFKQIGKGKVTQEEQTFSIPPLDSWIHKSR